MMYVHAERSVAGPAAHSAMVEVQIDNFWVHSVVLVEPVRCSGCGLAAGHDQRQSETVSAELDSSM